MMQWFWTLRIAGKLSLVAGVMLSLYGLSGTGNGWVRAGLILITLGIALMIVSSYHFLKSRGRDRGPAQWNKPDERGGEG